jgi:hypothetical protein
MKAHNHFSQGYGQLIKVLSLLLVFIIGCTKQDIVPTSLNENSNELNLKSLAINKGTIHLHGYMRWYVYAKEEHKLIVDPVEMYTMVDAELSFTDKQNFVLNTKEYFNINDPQTLFRIISFKGKITPGGELKYTWPKTWIELNWETMKLENTPYANVVAQIRAHTGYELFGPGVNKNTVNYKGFFDGTKFFADCHANALQQEPGEMGPPYDVVVVGPLIFSMSTELQVAD